MDPLMLILYLAVIGFVLYLILTYIPMPTPFKQGLMVLVVILVIFYLIRFMGGSSGVRVP